MVQRRSTLQVFVGLAPDLRWRRFSVSTTPGALALRSNKRCAACVVVGSVSGASAAPERVTYDAITTVARQRGLWLRKRGLGPLFRIEAYIEREVEAEWKPLRDRRRDSESSDELLPAGEALLPLNRQANRVLAGYVNGFCWAPLLHRTHVERIELLEKQSTGTPRAAIKFLALAAAVEVLRRRAPHCYFLAIDDGSYRHMKLVRYFERLGFRRVRRITNGLMDRLIWGGCGTLMHGDLRELSRSWWSDIQPLAPP